jgi:hypothetical protein
LQQTNVIRAANSTDPAKFGACLQSHAENGSILIPPQDFTISTSGGP